MAVRSAISVGFPGANYIAELGQRESALPGEYIVEGGHAVVTVLTGQIADLTLAATAQVIVAAAASPTIGNLTLSGVGNIAVTASLTETIDPVTLAATGQVIVSAAVDTAIGDITVAATGTVSGGSARPGDVPWWFHAYRRRIEAEREAQRLALAVEGDGAAVLPLFVGKGRLEYALAGENLPPAAGFAAGEIPLLFGTGSLEHDPDGDIDEVMAAVTLLIDTPERVNVVETIRHVVPEGLGADDDEEVLEIVAALIAA